MAAPAAPPRPPRVRRGPRRRPRTLAHFPRENSERFDVPREASARDSSPAAWAAAARGVGARRRAGEALCARHGPCLLRRIAQRVAPGHPVPAVRRARVGCGARWAAASTLGFSRAEPGRFFSRARSRGPRPSTSPSPRRQRAPRRPGRPTSRARGTAGTCAPARSTRATILSFALGGAGARSPSAAGGCARRPPGFSGAPEATDAHTKHEPAPVAARPRVGSGGLAVFRHASRDKLTRPSRAACPRRGGVRARRNPSSLRAGAECRRASPAGGVPGDRRAEQQRDRERLEREPSPDAESTLFIRARRCRGGVGSTPAIDDASAQRERRARRDVPAPHRSQPRHRERDREPTTRAPRHARAVRRPAVARAPARKRAAFSSSATKKVHFAIDDLRVASRYPRYYSINTRVFGRFSQHPARRSRSVEDPARRLRRTPPPPPPPSAAGAEATACVTKSTAVRRHAVERARATPAPMAREGSSALRRRSSITRCTPSSTLHARASSGGVARAARSLPSRSARGGGGARSHVEARKCAEHISVLVGYGRTTPSTPAFVDVLGVPPHSHSGARRATLRRRRASVRPRVGRPAPRRVRVGRRRRRRRRRWAAAPL